MNNSNTTTI